MAKVNAFCGSVRLVRHARLFCGLYRKSRLQQGGVIPPTQASLARHLYVEVAPTLRLLCVRRHARCSARVQHVQPAGTTACRNPSYIYHLH